MNTLSYQRAAIVSRRSVCYSSEAQHQSPRPFNAGALPASFPPIICARHEERVTEGLLPATRSCTSTRSNRKEGLSVARKSTPPLDADHEGRRPVNKLNNLWTCAAAKAPLMWLANSRGLYGLVVLKTEADARPGWPSAPCAKSATRCASSPSCCTERRRREWSGSMCRGQHARRRIARRPQFLGARYRTVCYVERGSLCRQRLVARTWRTLPG